jgi:hypothetical protein
MKHFKEITLTLLRGVIYTILHFVLIFQLSGCFLKQDRTTVVYGSITDQKGQPVDSILIILKGVQNLKYDSLGASYSNTNGEFEILQDVPKKYTTVNVVIPFGSYTNPNFQKNYKSYKIYKNDQQTNNCCTAVIGQKTKYNFELVPR